MSECECGKTKCIECEGFCPYCGDSSDIYRQKVEDKGNRLAHLLIGGV